MGQNISCTVNCQTSSQKSPTSFEFRIHKIVKNSPTLYFSWPIFLSLFTHFLKQRLGRYLQIGQDLFLPHPPHVIILRNPNVWLYIVTYTFEEALSNTPSIKPNFLSRKTRLQRWSLGKKLVRKLIRFSETSAKMLIRMWEVWVLLLPIALPAENFGSVFVIPASYFGGHVSIIDPDSH